MGNGISKLNKTTTTSSTASSAGTYSGVNRSGSETVFTDTSAHTLTPSHDFGHNPDIVQYFKDNSNIEQLLPLLNSTESVYFENWAAGWFMSSMGRGSSSQRKYSDLDPASQKMLRTYDKYIDKSEFHEGIVVRTLGGYSPVTGNRGVPSDAEWAKIVGNPVKLNMPMSAAAAAHGLTIGQKGKNVEYVWHIPPNTKGVAMPLVDRRVNPDWQERQREVMMNRDVYWRPGNRTFNKSRGVWEIQMYYVGKDKHDYKKRR